MEINIALSPLWNIAYGYARIYQNVTVLLHSNITDFFHMHAYTHFAQKVYLYFIVLGILTV